MNNWLFEQQLRRYIPNTKMCLYCSFFSILKSYCDFHSRETNAADFCVDFKIDEENKKRLLELKNLTSVNIYNKK